MARDLYKKNKFRPTNSKKNSDGMHNEHGIYNKLIKQLIYLQCFCCHLAEQDDNERMH